MPVPPRSSVRRVLRPRPRPRIRRVIGAGAVSPGRTAGGPASAHAAPLWPDLRVGEARAVTHAAEVRVVLTHQRFQVVGSLEAAIGHLVLELVDRHVLVLLLALQCLVAPRADNALELQHLGRVLLVVPAVNASSRSFVIVAFTTNSTVAMAASSCRLEIGILPPTARPRPW